MITLEMLAKQLEDKLNKDLDKYKLAGGITPSVNYKFRIVLDTADYKESERDGNTVTMYIHGIMTASSSDVEGVSDDTYNTGLDTNVEFLIPFLFTSGEGKNDELLQAIRNLLTDTLQSSTGEPLNVGGHLFYQGTSFSLATSGERGERPMVGDSYTMDLAIRYFFIALGVGSDDIELWYRESTEDKYLRIACSKAEFARTSMQDGNVFPLGEYELGEYEAPVKVPSSQTPITATVPSSQTPITATVPSSLTTTTASAFVIKLITPTRDTPFIRAAARYLLLSEVKPFWIKISYPMEYVLEYIPEDMSARCYPEYRFEVEKRMCFSDATLSTERSYNAASTMTLVEAADVNTLMS